MANVGRYKVAFNKSANASTVLMNLITLFIWLFIGEEIIGTLKTIINPQSGDVFYNTFTILGIAGATASTGGLTGIIGIILAVGVLVQVFKVTKM